MGARAVGVDELLAASGLRSAVEDAIEEGDVRLLADLYGRLAERYPDRPEPVTQQILALGRCHAWAEADERALRAGARFPDALGLALAHARNALHRHDWAVAIARFERLQARFDPRTCLGSAETLIEHLHCYQEMADADGALAAARRMWPMLERHRADAFVAHDGLHRCGDLLSGRQRRAFDAWLADTHPVAAGPYYAHRRLASAWNRAWIGRNAPDAALIALGQNCLPWILPNRWGLRPSALTLDAATPFDLLGLPGDAAAILIEQDFAPLLDPEALHATTTPQKVPILLNRRLGTMFFHEQGAWWAQDDWARLRAAYRRRVQGTRRAMGEGKRLYFHTVCGAGDPARLVEAFAAHLDDGDARLLVVNLLRQPVPLPDHPRVAARHIPYPEDYAWNAWHAFDSERGHAFEQEIVAAIRHELTLLRDWRTVVRRGRETVGAFLPGLEARR